LSSRKASLLREDFADSTAFIKIFATPRTSSRVTAWRWIMYRDGSGKKYLGSGPNPVFSPDANMIALVNGDFGGTPGIWKMRT
jgi:hypothetical protein